MFDTMESLLNAADGTDSAPHPTSPNHTSDGKFAKGNKASPGRPSKAQELAVLESINAAMPPERVRELIDRAVAMATEPGRESPRTLLAILQYCTSYQVGTPVHRTQQASNSLAELLAQLPDDDE